MIKRISKFNSSQWVGTKIEFYDILNIRWLVIWCYIRWIVINPYSKEHHEFSESVTRYNDTKFNGREWVTTKIEFYEILDIRWPVTFTSKNIEFSK